MTPQEGKRWIQSALTDLNAAQSLLRDGYYHLCAFHAQQSVEKALKGLLRLLSHAPWGHNCLNLLKQVDGLLGGSVIPSALFDAVQRLDAHYIPSRYPDAFPTGVPADHYDALIAQQAVDDATVILAFVDKHVP